MGAVAVAAGVAVGVAAAGLTMRPAVTTSRRPRSTDRSNRRSVTCWTSPPSSNRPRHQRTQAPRTKPPRGTPTATPTARVMVNGAAAGVVVAGARTPGPQPTTHRGRRPGPRAAAVQQGSSNEVTGIEGSTRMEAKRQRRREGREAGRRRPPILSEAEFLARRESVARKMIIRQRDDLSQIAVLEDDILVEHYVDRDSAASLIGNVYLGRVQNVLPSMEAAFIDIGRGRNAVLYAGEVDWDSFGAEGQNRKVEKVLKSGQTILVQVSKDPVGAKGARLTNHVSIPGRYIVYAPGGHLSGISRKLPDIERKRLKDILADLVGESASVIVRTAAEGASEEELVRDVNRLKAQWEDIERKVAAGQSPQLLYGEPDLTVRIVRDLFTEDFAELIIAGQRWPERRLRRDRGLRHPRRPAPERPDASLGARGRPRRVRRVPPGRADRQGPGTQGVPALRRLADHRAHRGDDGDRRQHRQVHRHRRQPRGHGHQQQPGGGRGDRAPAPAARHRRHHRDRLHRHGAAQQPRTAAAPPGRVPRPGPHPAPGRRGHQPGLGADDPEEDRHRAARGVHHRVPALPRAGRRAARHAGRVAEAARRRHPGAEPAPALRRSLAVSGASPAEHAGPRG